MNQNIKLYPAFSSLIAAGFSYPVIFLYFLSVVSLPEVLLLEAVLQFTVFFFEVPSGFFSDRFGRRTTLILAAVFQFAAYLFFLAADGFLLLAAGQFMFALSMAFKSGTDVSLLYDSLLQEQRQREFEPLIARFHKYMLFFISGAALIGGVVSLAGLSLALWLNLISAGLAFLLALRFVEPQMSGEEAAKNFFEQLVKISSYLKRRLVVWLFCFSIVAVLLDHIPYQFYQPYVQLLGFSTASAGDLTPVLTAGHFAATMMIGAWFAGHAVTLSRKMGKVNLLLGGSLIHHGMIVLMALFLNPLVALLIVFREIPQVLKHIVLNSLLMPEITSNHRASFLSLVSLAGKGAVGLFLIVLGLAAEPTAMADQMSQILMTAFGLCMAFTLLLVVTRPR